MSDRAEKAAERIRKWALPWLNSIDAEEHIASIIRGEYPEETVMQARAEHLEGVLRQVRKLMRRFVIRMMHGEWAMFYDTAAVDSVMAEITCEENPDA